MKTTIFAYADKDRLFDRAQALNLSDKATAMFIHAQEYQIEIEVDEVTGIVKPISVK